MATLSAGDLVNLRSTRHSSSVYLSVFQPVTLLTALVNNAAIARGARTIAFDTGSGSGFATIEAGQMLEVDTATGTEWVRVKSIAGAQAAGTITIDENPIVWADNLVIRIKHFYPIVPIPPRITGGVFYKFFDTVYSNQNSLQNPVAVTQGHLVGTLSAGTIAFSLSASASYAIANGATISTYLWSCVHNGGGTTGISFSSTSSATPTLTITVAGQYWLKLTVTDSNGKTQSTFRCIFVYDSSTLPYKDFTVSTVTGDWGQGGWRCTVQATGSAVTLADFPDMTLCILWYENKFDSTSAYINLWGSTTGQNIIMAGYLRNDSDNDNLAPKGTTDISFDITTPEAVIDTITLLGTVSLNYNASPATWYQLANMTVGRAVHHLLKWHTWVFETCDVLGLTDNTLKVKNIDLTEDSVLQMINNLAYGRGIFAKLVSSRLGRLHFVADSQMLNTAARAALDTTCAITVADISGTVDVMRQAEESLGTAELDGFSYNGTTGTPFISICPGYRESSISYGFPKFRGTSTQKTSGQVLIDQTDANEKVGRLLAVANNDPREFRFDCRGNYVGAFDIVPSTGWYTWSLANVDLKRQLALNGKKLVCRNVTHNINVTAGTVQTSVVLESEAIGPDGIQGNYPVGYPTPVLRVPIDTGGSSHFALTYGYFAGGRTGAAVVATTDRITFSTGVTAANVGSNLSAARSRAIGLSDSLIYGYFVGGTNFADTGHVATADRITLSTSVTAANAGSNLSAARVDLSPVSDGVTYGYFCGGEGPTPTFTTLTTVDRIVFATSITSAYGNLFSARKSRAGFSNGSTAGYAVGDQGITTTQRITFSTGAIAALAASAGLPNWQDWPGFANGLLAGYTLGDRAGGTPEAVIEKLTFATEVGSTLGSLISLARYGSGGVTDKTTYIYISGGDDGAVVVTADRFTLATEISAANSASNLTVARRWLGALTDGWV